MTTPCAWLPEYPAGRLTRCAYSIKSWEQRGLPRATDVALSEGLAFQCPRTFKRRALLRDFARQLFVHPQDVSADTQAEDTATMDQDVESTIRLLSGLVNTTDDQTVTALLNSSEVRLHHNLECGFLVF
jgi:hypothetical protein